MCNMIMTKPACRSFDLSKWVLLVPESWTGACERRSCIKSRSERNRNSYHYFRCGILYGEL